MVSILPLTFDEPDKLNADSEETLLVPLTANPSIIITFPVNPDSPNGTPVEKFAFPFPSNVETVKIFKISPNDQEWVELIPPDDSPVFDATEPIVLDESIAVSLLKFVPQSSSNNDENFKIKLQVHACLQVTPSTSEAPTTTMGIYLLKAVHLQ